MKHNLTTTNQNAKLALSKSKSLLNITNSLLTNRPSKELIERFENFRISISFENSCWVNSIAVSPDGKYIVSGDGEVDDVYEDDETGGNIKLWDICSGKELQTFEGHSWGVSSVAITPDGNYIVSGSPDSTIRLWELNSGKELRIFEGSYSWGVNSVAISPDGQFIIGGDEDRTIKLWEISSAKELRTFKGHKHRVRSVTITQDGKYIVSGDGGGYLTVETIKLWEITTGEELHSFEGHNDWINSVSISPNGKYIVSGDGAYGTTGTIKLWDISTGKELYSFKEDCIVSSVAITPDGKYIVSGGSTIKLWELNSGKELQTFKGNNDWVSSVAITPNGKYIVSGGNTIKLWELNSGKLLCSYVAYENGEWFSWTPDGYYNCSDGAYQYFSFVDDSKEMPESVPKDHPVYKAKKKEILLSDYIGGANPYAKNPPPQTDIGEYDAIPQIDIDEDEIPF